MSGARILQQPPSVVDVAFGVLSMAWPLGAHMLTAVGVLRAQVCHGTGRKICNRQPNLLVTLGLDGTIFPPRG